MNNIFKLACVDVYLLFDLFTHTQKKTKNNHDLGCAVDLVDAAILCHAMARMAKRKKQEPPPAERGAVSVSSPVPCGC